MLLIKNEHQWRVTCLNEMNTNSPYSCDSEDNHVLFYIVLLYGFKVNIEVATHEYPSFVSLTFYFLYISDFGMTRYVAELVEIKMRR